MKLWRLRFLASEAPVVFERWDSLTDAPVGVEQVLVLEAPREEFLSLAHTGVMGAIWTLVGLDDRYGAEPIGSVGPVMLNVFAVWSPPCNRDN